MKETKFAWQRQMAGLSIIVLMLSACAATPDSSPRVSSLAARGPEQIFAMPSLASEALADATRQDNKAALLRILGPNASKLISSGDPVADKEGRDKFIAAYDSAHEFESEGDNKEVLVVGEEEWPLPIPLVRVADNSWQFDTEAGEQEILNRRIGRNEINVIEVSHAYVEAQRDYAVQHRLPNGQPEYAQHFISTKGKHDGLYWPAKAGEEESPLGPLVANARAEGYNAGEKHNNAGGKHNNAGGKHNKRQPYHGYYYKILKQQGPGAPGGAKNYIVGDHMTGGFALIAFPASYGNSGIMTFIVDQNGIVFEKNLGPETAKLAAQITQYDPDESWQTGHYPQQATPSLCLQSNSPVRD